MHGVMFMILESFFKEKEGGVDVWHQVKKLLLLHMTGLLIHHIQAQQTMIV